MELFIYTTLLFIVSPIEIYLKIDKYLKKEIFSFALPRISIMYINIKVDNDNDIERIVFWNITDRKIVKKPKKISMTYKYREYPNKM